MKVFNCILGILTVLASIYCIFYPGLTFLNIGWIVTIILGLWGISSIVSYAASRNDGNNKEKALMGTLGLIAGIAQWNPEGTLHLLLFPWQTFQLHLLHKGRSPAAV